MELKVLLFAQARQIAGSEIVTITVGNDATVADLKKALADAYPNLEPLLKRSNIAMDQKYAVDGDAVGADVEVALIPPVSGG